jgi:hypothetical protein
VGGGEDGGAGHAGWVMGRGLTEIAEATE